MIRTKEGSLTSYSTAFLLCIFCTVAPYLLVRRQLLQGSVLLAVIIGFALVQAVIQLVFFYHLGKEKKPRRNLLVLLFMLLVLLVVVFGSIWIMYHLNYEMMPAMTDLQHQKGL